MGLQEKVRENLYSLLVSFWLQGQGRLWFLI